MNEPNTQRPVIPGFHPDPSICRVGDTYHLACSSFEFAPGVPILRSVDLRAWELIGHALHSPAHLDVTDAGPSGGVFAPTLRHHDGRFWMITTNWSDGGGHVLTWADDAAGPWAPPLRIPTLRGIDPDLAWDDDGTCFVTFAGVAHDGRTGIVQVELDLGRGVPLTEPKWIWGGTGGKFPEGPHLYRIGGTWYLLIAEGGTERGHAITVARGSSPRGPFQSNPGNPLLTRRGTDWPVQNTGHGDLVECTDGTWAIVYHGVRPRGSSPEWHVLGRETFADEVVWVDGWPRLTDRLDPAIAPDVPVGWQLPAGVIPADWVADGCFPDAVMRAEGEGWAVTAGGAGPTFVGRRQEHRWCNVVAQVSARDGSVGGIAVRIDARHAVELEVDDGTVRAVWAIGDVRHVLGAIGDEPGPVRLELAVGPTPPSGRPFDTGTGPDRIVATATVGGVEHVLGGIDGRYVSTEVAGGMTGRMLGIVCARGEVTVRSFEYVGSDG